VRSCAEACFVEEPTQSLGSLCRGKNWALSSIGRMEVRAGGVQDNDNRRETVAVVRCRMHVCVPERDRNHVLL